MTDETPVSETASASPVEPAAKVLPLPGMKMLGWAECVVDLSRYGWGTVLIRDPSLSATAQFVAIATTSTNSVRIAAAMISAYFVKGDAGHWPTRGAPLDAWEKAIAGCPSKPIDELIRAVRRFREMFAADIDSPN